MEKNKIATIVMGVSALCLLIAVFTKGWFSESKSQGGMEVSMGIGIWGTAKAEMCMEGKCESHSESMKFSDAKKGKDKAWLAFGKIGFIALLLAVVALGAGAAMSWLGNPMLAKACLGAMATCGLGALCVLMFLVLKPDGLPGIGFSFFLGVLGIAGGFVGASMGKKVAAGAA
jgi:hypothetical protein